MKEYTYFAFISYAHKDEKHAAWLQKSLENYRIPVKLRKTHGSDIPKRVRPVFRDKTDLRPGNLEKSLASELDDSRYLIVICSPASKYSTWVNQEIGHFRQTDRADNVIPLIVDCPQISTVTDCYPDALDKSVLGISLKEFGKTKTLLHVLSRILDIRFDSLYERHKKAQNRKSVLIALLSLIMLFALSFPTREYIEIEQQQQALTNAVSSA
ncbi:MAG: toll/interleukin-1 receptor domain-containing protein, partial [Pelodictyon phaeoclathratiforme]